MRNVIRLVAILCSCLAVLGAGPAQAEKRVALVIGNSAYQYTRTLPNPKNDAEAIAKLLRDNGFAEVILKSDLDYRAMREAVRRFADTAQAAEVALVYYAGHGLEVAGENYLVPIDAKLLRDFDLDFEAVPLTLLLGAVDGARRLKLVVLDACRNNPLGDRMALRAGRTRTVTRGLGRLEATGEVLVAYAAKAGTLAQDGAGRHSPYSEALLKHMATPGLDVIRMFGRVKEAVQDATNGGQEPWIYGSPGGDSIALVPAKVAVSAPLPPSGEAERAWAAAKDTTSIAVLEDFVARYKETFYAGLARARIDELKKQQVAVVTPPEKAMPAAKPLEAKPLKVTPLEAKPLKVSPLEVKPLTVTPPKVVEPPAAVSRSRAAVALTAAEERALKPGDGFRECDVCPEMVVMPVGGFMMGSPTNEKEREPREGPQHRVTIARPFAVGKFEVTFAEWDACVATGGCKYSPKDYGGRGKLPVVMVSWHDITTEYLPWLARTTGKNYRLLTEAEWEYVARAGTTTPYATGHTIAMSQANFDNTKGTIVVGSFPPNAFGLHDMHGNVWEWVQDCWHTNYQGAPADGTAWTTANCTNRVYRSGHRSAARNYEAPDPRWPGRNSGVGFRVARTFLDKAPVQRPDASEYSKKIWPLGTIPQGVTVSSDTPHGKLSCTTGGPSTRLCSWQ